MHTGLDFRAPTGDPVRATANGKVASSGWQGGYGRMVEIDHGNGFVTRYGHLSAIDVHVGQTLKIGQTVGVLYDPGHPREARIDRGRWNKAMPILIGAFGALLCLLGLWILKRRAPAPSTA